MQIITDKQRLLMKRATFKHLIDRGVQNEDELWFVVAEVFGMKIPREVCCDDHEPFWKVATDDFFHRVKNQAVRSCRGGGKTMTVGAIKAVKAVAYSGIRISNFAATEQQGMALWGYVEKNLGPSADPVIQSYVQELYGSVATTKPRAVEGRDKPESSRLKVLVGTLKGVNSTHVEDLVVDERAQMEDEVFSEAMGMMTASPPYPGVLTVLSTVKAKGDPMDVLMTEADSLGFRAYTNCILDCMTCQEANCDGCKATLSTNADKSETKSFYDFCKGRILGSKIGHISVASAQRKFGNMGLENARAQLFCTDPEGTELAFPQWSHKNVRDMSDVIAALYVTGYYVFGDFGKRDDSCWHKARYIPSLKLVYVEDEIVDNNKTIDEWVQILDKNGWGPQAWAFLVDTAGRQTTITSKKSAIDHLEDKGWKVIDSVLDELETTDRLRDLIKAERFIVHPRCKKTIEGFERATNKSIGTKEAPVYLKVIKHNKWSHRVDSARYGVAHLCPADDTPETVTKYKLRGRR